MIVILLLTPGRNSNLIPTILIRKPEERAHGKVRIRD
jgi:hypothetical protein